MTQNKTLSEALALLANQHDPTSVEWNFLVKSVVLLKHFGEVGYISEAGTLTVTPEASFTDELGTDYTPDLVQTILESWLNRFHCGTIGTIDGEKGYILKYPTIKEGILTTVFQGAGY